MHIIALLLVVLLANGAESPTTDAARQVIAHTGKQRGVAWVAGGAWAQAVALASEMLVIGQESSATATMAAREQADRANLLGRRLIIAHAAAGEPVVADHVANLVFVPIEDDAALGQLNAMRLLRAATAHGGKVIVGGRRATKPALTAWGKTLGKPADATQPGAQVEIATVAGGTWLVATKAALPGAAEWTHRLHDSSFNPVTPDTAFTMPSMTQWLGTPFNHGAGAPRIAGGRMLMVMEGQYNSRDQCDVNHLIMRDAYNGQVLWNRDLGDEYAADWFLSACVLTADALYLMDMGKPAVLVLDPETGAERRRLDLSAHGGMVKWIALSGGTLFAALGDVEPARGGGWGGGGLTAAQHTKFITDPAEKNSLPTRGTSRTIVAVDPTKGATRWNLSEEADCIPDHLIAVHGGRLYYLAQGRHAAAVSVTDGAVLWKTTEAAEILAKNLKKDFVLATGALMASESTVLVSRPGSSRIALDAATGKVLWSAPLYGHQHSGSMIWSDYVLGQTSVELRTGTPAFADRNANPYQGSCNFNAASQRYMGGINGATFDMQEGKKVARPTCLKKAPCSMGSVIGEGVLFMAAFHCTCMYQVNGNLVEIAGDGTRYQTPATERERLVVSLGAAPKPLPLTAQDWPTGRGGNQRSNSSTASVPAAVRLRWNWAPEQPFANPPFLSDRSTTNYESPAPIAIHDQVIAASPDGVVRGLALTDGRARWVYRAGAHLSAAPTVTADGRLYVGANDGWVTCLAATDGRELWRFRAAPAERWIMAYGHPVSTWPVTTGVLVEDGVACFAASLLNYNASHVYGLDAATGKILWQDNTAGLIAPASADGISAVGTLAYRDGRVWLRGASWNLRSGERATYLDARQPNLIKQNHQGYLDGANGLLNRNTGWLPGNLLALGGRRFFGGQNNSVMGKGMPFRLFEVDAAGKAIGRSVDLIERTDAFAAWDERQVVVQAALENQQSINGAVKHSPVLCWDLTKLQTFVRSEREQSSGLLKKNSRIDTIVELPMHQWLQDAHRTYAVALTANAVVVAAGTMDGADKIPRSAPTSPNRWHCAAFARADGKELWRAVLPSEPVVDGLCIARDGTAIVQLLDGGVVAVGK
jgi:outer membrane protein assembly factor BamB